MEVSARQRWWCRDQGVVGRGLQESQGPPGSHTFQRCPTTERSYLCAQRAEKGFAPGSALCSFRPTGWRVEVFTLGWRDSGSRACGVPWAGNQARAGFRNQLPGAMEGLQRKKALCCWGAGGRGEVGVEISFSVGRRSLEPGVEG